MVIATHLIKIKGTFDDNKWEEKALRNFVDNKINNEIEHIYHPDLELFQVKDRTIEVWIYISDSIPNLLGEIVGNWLKYHIKEDGLAVDSIEIEKSSNGFFVLIT